jgi:hypothetical protein
MEGTLRRLEFRGDEHVGIRGSPKSAPRNDDCKTQRNSKKTFKPREFLFIIFVNAMFTTFVELRFTKLPE